MTFIKEETYRRNNILRTAAVLIAAAGLLTALVSGCSPVGKDKEPQGASVTVSSSDEEKSNFEKYEAKLSSVEGNVSKYDLGPVDDRNTPQYTVAGKYVYYLSNVDGKYELKRINTEDPSGSGVARFENDRCFCHLYNYAFRYENETEVTFMDLDLNEIVKIPNTDNYEEIIRYKDSYLVMNGEDLLLLSEGNLVPFKKLRLANFSLLTSQTTADNTWLLFNDNNESGAFTFYIYNVNEDKYEIVSDMGYNFFSDGFYDINGNRVMIRNLSESRGQEYEAQYKSAPFNTYFDGQRVYLADPNDMTVKFYDPSKQTLCVLSEYEFGKYNISIMGTYGNKVFVSFSQEVYVIDSTGAEEIPIAEYNIILHGKIDDLETEIRDQYSINILTGKAAAKYRLSNIKAEAVEDDFRIYYSVKQIYKYIKRFGKDFFKEFRYGTSQGLYILLTGATEVTNDGAKIDASGVAFRQDDRFYIILNIHNDYAGKNFCHEIMHSMEQNSDSETLFPDWKKYNPKGFKYTDSYANTADAKYSIEGPDGYDIYFFDVYSKTNAMEDRARVFENLLGVEKDECRVNDLPKIKEKALYIRERIYKLYPSLKETDIFKNLDG